MYTLDMLPHEIWLRIAMFTQQSVQRNGSIRYDRPSINAFARTCRSFEEICMAAPELLVDGVVDFGVRRDYCCEHSMTAPIVRRCWAEPHSFIRLCYANHATMRGPWTRRYSHWVCGACGSEITFYTDIRPKDRFFRGSLRKSRSTLFDNIKRELSKIHAVGFCKHTRHADVKFSKAKNDDELEEEDEDDLRLRCVDVDDATDMLFIRGLVKSVNPKLHTIRVHRSVNDKDDDGGDDDDDSADSNDDEIHTDDGTQLISRERWDEQKTHLLIRHQRNQPTPSDNQSSRFDLKSYAVMGRFISVDRNLLPYCFPIDEVYSDGRKTNLSVLWMDVVINEVHGMLYGPCSRHIKRARLNYIALESMLAKMMRYIQERNDVILSEMYPIQGYLAVKIHDYRATEMDFPTVTL